MTCFGMIIVSNISLATQSTLRRYGKFAKILCISLTGRVRTDTDFTGRLLVVDICSWCWSG